LLQNFQTIRAAAQSPVLFSTPFFKLEWKHDAQILDCVQGLKQVSTQRPRKLRGAALAEKMVQKKKTKEVKTRPANKQKHRGTALDLTTPPRGKEEKKSHAHGVRRCHHPELVSK
jgi:hypothetical protein